MTDGPGGGTTGGTTRTAVRVARLGAAVVVAMLLTGACQDTAADPAGRSGSAAGSPRSPAGTSGPNGAATTTSPSPRTTACPTPEPTAVDPDRVQPSSVLVPGPSNGLSASPARGDRLVFVGRVVDSSCQPVMGAVVNVWHTDAAGDYGTEAVECCYYQGSVSTDRSGLFRLTTVRPGQYNEPNAPPQHIHLEISHLSGRVMTELWFADDPSVPARPPGDVIVLALRKIDRGGTGGTSWQGAATFILGT